VKNSPGVVVRYCSWSVSMQIAMDAIVVFPIRADADKARSGQ
jgi:hypothetical protein